MNVIALHSRTTVGEHLRHWRQQRRLTQLDVALLANTSTRHMSFIETGRAQPSREMLLRLCDRLAVPLRQRNALFVAAGFAPMYPERQLDDPGLHVARRAIDRVLAGHEPYPAIAVDRHWTMVAANRVVAPLLAGVADELLAPPVNVMRLSVHPQGLGSRIVNYIGWREHVMRRLQQQIELTGDPGLAELQRELSALPFPANAGERQPHDATADYADMVVPLRLRSEAGELSLFSTITVFGTPVDVTLAELAIESFFPADEATAQALQAIAATAM